MKTVVDRRSGEPGYHESAKTEATASAPVSGSEGIDVPQAPVQAMGFRVRRPSDEPPDAEPSPASRTWQSANGRRDP